MLLLALLFVGSWAAGTDIYKCTDEEGNVAYLQTPCPEDKKPDIEAPVAAEIDDVADDSEAAEETAASPPIAGGRPFEEVEACKQPHRDEVDAIFVALGGAYTPEQGEEFKKRLRTLTQQMRACG